MLALAGEAMTKATNDLPEPIKRQAEKILYDIELAGSMILAVKNGAKAQGFILGIICCNGLSIERCERLSDHFDNVLEQ